MPGAKNWGSADHVAVTSRSAQVQLSIDIDSEPIAGSVTMDSGAPQRFTGWIELVATIESARHAGSSGGHETLGALPGANGGGV